MTSHPTPNKQHRCWANEQCSFQELLKSCPKCLLDQSFKQRWRITDMLGESGLLLIDTGVFHGIYLTKQGWQYAGYMNLDDSYKQNYFTDQNTNKALQFIFSLYAIK